MASPPGIGLYKSRQVWAWTTSTLLVLSLIGVLLWTQHLRHSFGRILESETKQAIEATREAVQHGNFRAFVELLGTRFSDPYVKVGSAFGNLEMGSPSVLPICSIQSLESTSIKVCGPSQIPWSQASIILSIFLLLSFGARLVLTTIEEKAIASMTSTFAHLELPNPLLSGMTPLLAGVSDLRRSVVDLQERDRRLSKKAQLTETAQKVAHDIRSPLSALKVLASSPEELNKEEGRNLFRMATARLVGIVDDFREKSGDDLEIVDLVPLLSSGVQEKLLERSNRRDVALTLNIEAKELNCRVESKLFQRVLSNLLNNSFEAIHSRGTIQVTAAVLKDSKIRIEIVDDGVGIPATILNILRKEQISYGKVKGSGLGFNSAREWILCWGGSISISSTENVGTSVRIELPSSDLQRAGF